MEKQAVGQTLTRHHFRFVILVLATACLMIVFSCMISINFTLVCMDPSRSDSNETINYDFPTYTFSQTEKTYIQWTVSIASMIATFPFIWLCNEFGAKMVFFVSGIVSAIATVLIPLSLSYSFNWFLVVRVFQGLAYACDFSVIGVLVTRWAALTENAKFIALMTCFSPLANTFTNGISGWICDSPALGWPWVHYIHSFICLILFILWFIFYNDDPKTNKFVSSTELAIIYEGKSETHKSHSSFVPYKEICKSKVVWSVWLNAFADLFSGFFLFIYAPTYTKKVLGMSATETGIVGALGSLSHIPVKLACGYVSDTYNCMPERKKMWIFNSVALLCPAIIYVYLCFASSEYPMVVVLLFGAVHATLGFNCGGFYKSGALASRQYAHFVISFTQFIKCGVFFVAPALVAIFVQDDSVASQWHIIFYMIAAWLAISNVVFCIYATDQPQAFTYIEEPEKKKSKYELNEKI